MPTARRAQPADLDEMLTLYEMLNSDDPSLEPTARVESHWQQMLAEESLDIVVVEHDDRLVSSCLLSVTRNLSRNMRPFAVLENVVTHEAYRGNGFATMCVEYAVERAREQDCYKVMLLTGSNKQWKHDFYEGCGFDRGEKTGFVLDL